MQLRKSFAPSIQGDILYTSPWDWHGIKNTGTETLSFVVFKWNYKGVPPPIKPSLGRR